MGVLAGVKGLNEDVLKEAGQAIEAVEETQKEESAQKLADGRLQREVPENDSSRKMDFSDEMAIMAGFSSAQIDAFIYALRKKGVGRIDYKAVLTPYNMKWDSVQLYEEIKKEHKMMTGKVKTNHCDAMGLVKGCSGGKSGLERSFYCLMWRWKDAGKS